MGVSIATFTSMVRPLAFKAVQHVDMPFAGKRYTPDYSRMSALYMRLGDALAEHALRKGDIAQRGVQGLGELFQGYQQRRQGREAAKTNAATRQREREEDKKFEAEQAGLSRAERAAERSAAEAARKVEREAEATARKLERDEAAVGDAIDKAPRGIVDMTGNRALMDTAKRFPAQAARFVQQDGVDVLPMTGGEKQTYEREKGAAAARATDDKRLQEQFEELKRHNKASEQRPPGASEPLVPIVGPDGKTRYGTRAEARGSVVPAGAEKPSSGVQKRALAFFNRAAQADTELEGMEASIQGLDLGGQTWMKFAPNFAQTQLGQSYTQAQRAFTEARLRKDSGAAIPPYEYAADRKTYFAEPGDSPETLEKKRKGRAAILASLGFESGQALGEFVGDTDEAKRIVNGYRERAASGVASPSTPPAPGTVERWERGPDGRMRKVGG